MSRTAVLVTGSREWTDYAPIRERLRLYPEGTVLLHGDCGRLAPAARGFGSGARLFVGADKIAAGLGAGYLGFNVWPLPYFEDLGKAGGPRRNEGLVGVLAALWRVGFRSYVEAFPKGASPGTRGCIRIAERVGESLAAGSNVFTITVTEGS